jgi:hypothetical protein
MFLQKFLSALVALLLPMLAACSATDSEDVGIDRSYTMTSFSHLPLPEVIGEGPFGSSTLTEGQLQLKRNGTYSLSYTLVISTNGVITTDRRSESGKYSIRNNAVDFLPGYTHSVLDAEDDRFSRLTGGISIRPCACGYQSATYVEVD